MVLVFYEMKIKESIVYDKHSSTVIGFVELNDVYDQLFQLEHNDGDKSRPIATHILAVMVRDKGDIQRYKVSICSLSH